MRQITSKNSFISRVNLKDLNAIGIVPTGEYILVNTANNMTEDGQGSFDAYIKGDGTKTATELPLIKEFSRNNYIGSWDFKAVMYNTAGNVSHNPCGFEVGKIYHLSITIPSTPAGRLTIKLYNAATSATDSLDIFTSEVGATSFEFNYFCDSADYQYIVAYHSNSTTINNCTAQISVLYDLTSENIATKEDVEDILGTYLMKENSIGVFDYTAAKNGAANLVSTVPCGFEVGKRYKILINLASVTTGTATVILVDAPRSNTEKKIYISNTNVQSLELEYVPESTANYQYIGVRLTENTTIGGTASIVLMEMLTAEVIPTTTEVDAMIDEKINLSDDNTDNAGGWVIKNTVVEGTDYNLTVDSTNKHLVSLTQIKQMYGTKFGFLLSQLKDGETYTLTMGYSNTGSTVGNMYKYSNPNDTAGTSYGTGELIKSSGRTLIVDFIYDAANPYIGWYCSGMGAGAVLTITSFSITKSISLEDIKDMASEGNATAVDDTPILMNSKYVSHTNRTGVLNLLHFSDIHGDANAAAYIKQYYDKYSDYIDDVIDTGDTVKYQLEHGISFLADVGLGNALRTIGNHDAWDQNSALVAKTDVYNVMIAPYVSNWGVVQPTNAASEGLNYWYKDYADYGIRLIGLDCMYPTANQLSWFSQTMADTLNSNNSAYGYTVVVASHYISSNVTDESGFVKYRNELPSFTIYGVTSRIAAQNQFIDEQYPTAVDTFINNGGKFAVWLCGHFHSDAVFYPTSHQNIFTVNIDKAGNNSAYNEGDRAARTVGTENNACANVVGIDTTNGLVKLIRVGLKSDKYLRPIKTLTYDYINRKVIENN